VSGWQDEPGLFQVVCGCLNEMFDFVITDFTIVVRCSDCGQVNGEFPRPAGWQPFGSTAPALEPGERVTLPTVTGAPRPGPVIAAGWAGELPGMVSQRDTLKPQTFDTSGVAEVDLGPPAASAAAANAVLGDGTWAGRLLALPPGVDIITLPDGTYRLQPERDTNGRMVYLKGPADVPGTG